MKNISIVIPIHNRLRLTQKGLQYLHDAIIHYYDFSERDRKVSIIVVDDGSTDGSSEWITRNYPDIHLLKGDGNLWWTGSVNKGSRYAVEQLNTDHVILWNDDTVCDKNYFVELSEFLKNNPKYEDSILASKILWMNEDNILFNYGCYYSRKTGKKKVIGLNQKDNDQFNTVIPIDWSGGMGTIIPAEILKKLDYFDDTQFPQYHGDIDFFLRAGKMGYQSYAVPTLKIYNNRETTGISKTKSISDLRKLLASNRSNYNIKQNLYFNYRHSNTLFSWVNFTSKYLTLTTQSLIYIACS